MKGRRGSVAKPLLEDEHALEKFPNDEPADLCTRYIQRTKGQVLKRLLPWIIHGAILVLSSFMFLAIFLPSIHSSAFCNDRVEANKPHLPCSSYPDFYLVATFLPRNSTGITGPAMGRPTVSNEYSGQPLCRSTADGIGKCLA